MKTIFTLLAAVSAVGATSSSGRILYPLEPIDHRTIACGCTFYMITEESKQDLYSGPHILVLDPNGEPPNARINLGAGNVRLRPSQPIEFPLYECVRGEVWTSEWQSEAVSVRTELTSLRPGEESCAFNGNVIATQSSRQEVTPVYATCGC